VPEYVFETDVHNESFWEELRLRSRLGKLLFLIALFGIVCCLVVSFGESLAALHGPRSPNFARGLIVPFNNHGDVHYMSRARAMWLDISFAMYFPCFVVLAAFVLRAKLLRK
jgi:hypothetical protein